MLVAVAQHGSEHFFDFRDKGFFVLHGGIDKRVREDFRHNALNVSAELFDYLRHRHDHVDEKIGCDDRKALPIVAEQRYVFPYDLIDFAFVGIIEAFDQRIVFLQHDGIVLRCVDIARTYYFIFVRNAAAF